MSQLVLRTFVEVATAIAGLRCLWVFYGLTLMVRTRVYTGRVRWDLPIVLCIPEPFLLALTTARQVLERSEW